MALQGQSHVAMVWLLKALWKYRDGERLMSSSPRLSAGLSGLDALASLVPKVHKLIDLFTQVREKVVMRRLRQEENEIKQEMPPSPSSSPQSQSLLHDTPSHE